MLDSVKTHIDTVTGIDECNRGTESRGQAIWKGGHRFDPEKGSAA
jgi:hypothetical protein